MSWDLNKGSIPYIIIIRISESGSKKIEMWLTNRQDWPTSGRIIIIGLYQPMANKINITFAVIFGLLDGCMKWPGTWLI